MNVCPRDRSEGEREREYLVFGLGTHATLLCKEMGPSCDEQSWHIWRFANHSNAFLFAHFEMRNPTHLSSTYVDLNLLFQGNEWGPICAAHSVFPVSLTSLHSEPAGSAVNTSLHGSEGHKFMNNWTNTKEIIP